MVYCAYCERDVDMEGDETGGYTCCVQCGRVLEEGAFSNDVTFVKDAGGESAVMGQFVGDGGVARGVGRLHMGRLYAHAADSHERAQAKGRTEIAALVDQLGVRPREDSVEASHRLYRLALQRGFTRGRRTASVAAVCLYVICRQESKPFLLIDFSDRLGVNVFTLGAIFLQLLRLLRLDDHPALSGPADPSLYIHRFATALGFGDASAHRAVSNTARRLVASMNRDWIQTGRRPAGVCGAALYVAAHIHGHARSKRDVVRVVRVGEYTLSRRLEEFGATAAAGLRPEEFERQALEVASAQQAALERGEDGYGEGDGGGAGGLAKLAAAAQSPSRRSRHPAPGAPGAPSPAQPSPALGCVHVQAGAPQFARSMCRACFADFVETTGGLHPGAHPPAFVRARRGEARALERGQDRDECDDIAGAMQKALLAPGLASFAKLLPREEEEQEAGAEPEVSRRPDGARRGTGLPLAEEPAAQEEPESREEPAPRGEPAPVGRRSRRKAEAARVAEAGREAEAAQASPAPAFGGRMTRRRAAQAAEAAGEAETARGAQAAGEAEPARGGEEAEPRERASEAAPAAPAPTSPATVAGAGAEERPSHGPESLSDLSDSELDGYLAGPSEVEYKKEIWEMVNREWIERRAAKQLVLDAAEKAAAEQKAAQEAAEAAGQQYKRPRGRPLGSKTKPRADADLPPAETAQEATMRMLDNRKLSSKVNYAALAGLFDDEAGSDAEIEGAGGPEEVADGDDYALASGGVKLEKGLGKRVRFHDDE